MAELETPPTSDDPIASLYKMSTTAGMGAGDYVEVNRAAVVSVVLAVCSLLSMLGWPFLLLGLAAVICGLVALRQIHCSSGTQGGRAVAWVGIGGALLIAGGVFTTDLVRRAGEAADGRRINDLINQLGAALASADYERARSLFVPEFQQKMPPEKFKSVWVRLNESGSLGSITGLKGNDRFSFTHGKGGAVYFGFTKCTVQFEKDPQAGVISVIGAREEGGAWRLYDLPEVFPKTMPIPR